MKTKVILNFSFLFLLLFNGCKAQDQSNSLKLIATVTLSEVRGRISYTTINK